MYASILKSWVRKRERRANCCGFSVLRGIVSQTLLLQRWTSLFSRLLGERGRSQGGPPSSEVSLNGGRGEQRRRKKGSSIKIPFTFLFTFSFFHFLSLSLSRCLSSDYSLYILTSCWRFSLPCLSDSFCGFSLAGAHDVDDTRMTHSSKNANPHRAHLIFCHLFVFILY